MHLTLYFSVFTLYFCEQCPSSDHTPMELLWDFILFDYILILQVYCFNFQVVSEKLGKDLSSIGCTSECSEKRSKIISRKVWYLVFTKRSQYTTQRPPTNQVESCDRKREKNQGAKYQRSESGVWSDKPSKLTKQKMQLKSSNLSPGNECEEVEQPHWPKKRPKPKNTKQLPDGWEIEVLSKSRLDRARKLFRWFTKGPFLNKTVQAGNDNNNEIQIIKASHRCARKKRTE